MIKSKIFRILLSVHAGSERYLCYVSSAYSNSTPISKNVFSSLSRSRPSLFFTYAVKLTGVSNDDPRLVHHLPTPNTQSTDNKIQPCTIQMRELTQTCKSIRTRPAAAVVEKRSSSLPLTELRH